MPDNFIFGIVLNYKYRLLRLKQNFCFNDVSLNAQLISITIMEMSNSTDF